MVFTALPAYLDPANYLQQQQVANYQPGGTSGASVHLPPPPPSAAAPQGGGGAGSIRPGSMADRARLVNIPMPEAALKCPRCESINTKFCYFNNYSLSQPRHFCKTCRRYWTRGGALRNIPVGGGCRRNKRSSKGSNSSKSSHPALSSGDRQTGSASTGRTISCHSIGTSSCTSTDILGLGAQLPQLRFMGPSNNLTGHHHDDLGLSYGAVNSVPLVGGTSELGFQIGSAAIGTGTAGSASLLVDQWRLQQGSQFPSLGGFDSSCALYPFEASSYGGGVSQVRAKLSATGVATQLASVKMEDSNNYNNQNFSRQYFGGVNPADHIQYNWSSTSPTSWCDISSFSSSSTTNPL